MVTNAATECLRLKTWEATNVKSIWSHYQQITLSKIQPSDYVPTGAFRSSSTVRLNVRSGEQPLQFRREQLSL